MLVLYVGLMIAHCLIEALKLPITLRGKNAVREIGSRRLASARNARIGVLPEVPRPSHERALLLWLRSPTLLDEYEDRISARTAFLASRPMGGAQPLASEWLRNVVSQNNAIRLRRIE